MQRFFTDTIESRFVKHILHEIFLPTIDTVSAGDYLFKDKFYVYKQSLLQCKESGYLYPQKATAFRPDSHSYINPTGRGDVNLDEVVNSEDLTKLARHIAHIQTITDPDELVQADVNFDNAVNAKDMTRLAKIVSTNTHYNDYYEYIPNSSPEAKVVVEETYIPYTLYPKYCNRFVSKNVFYDTETHKRLGKYLRFFRDIYDIDLMPFYNCYAGETVNNISLDSSGYSFNYSPQLKTYQIPIKYNKKYTIAIDAPSEVTIAPCILFKGNLEIINGVDLNSLLVVENNSSRAMPLCSFSKKYYGLSFNKPIVFTLPCNNPTLYEYQKNLSLLIQVPASNTSSMVVLEGDYTNLGVNTIVNLDSEYVLNDKDMNNVLLSKLHLLQINDNVRYAFSDRLVEYLVRNVITPRDRLGMNIQRVQQAGFKTSYPNTNLGVWYPEMRYLFYKNYMEDNSNNKLDINGFVDVDMEKFINKGQQ